MVGARAVAHDRAITRSPRELPSRAAAIADGHRADVRYGRWLLLSHGVTAQRRRAARTPHRRGLGFPFPSGDGIPARRRRPPRRAIRRRRPRLSLTSGDGIPARRRRPPRRAIPRRRPRLSLTGSDGVTAQRRRPPRRAIRRRRPRLSLTGGDDALPLTARSHSNIFKLSFSASRHLARRTVIHPAPGQPPETYLRPHAAHRHGRSHLHLRALRRIRTQVEPRPTPLVLGGRHLRFRFTRGERPRWNHEADGQGEHR